jgi:hypothetical protein
MLINEIQVEQAQARREREVSDRIRARQLRLPSPSVRRAVGRSMISIGSRLAAEPNPRLARSR